MAYTRQQTLTAGTVATFTFDDNSSGVRIVNRSATEAFVTIGDTGSVPANPTVAGNNTELLPGVIGATIEQQRLSSNPIVVKVISSGTPAITVGGIN